MVQIPRWQILVILGVLLAGLAFAAPNLIKRETLDQLPSWVPSEPVNLGLDLRGGSYLLLEVDIEGVFEEQLAGFVDSVRVELRRVRIGYTGLGLEGDSVVFSLREPGDIERAREVLHRHHEPDFGVGESQLLPENGQQDEERGGIPVGEAVSAGEKPHLPGEARKTGSGSGGAHRVVRMKRAGIIAWTCAPLRVDARTYFIVFAVHFHP